jgi:hypothetical protein
MKLHCTATNDLPGHSRPSDRRTASALLRARLGTGLLVAASLALMSPPAALAQADDAAGTSYLSDRDWTSMTNGWGPVEKDKSNNEQAAGDGAALTINGVTYPKGLGVHAPSDLRYLLSGACTSLMAVVGVDDEKGAEGSVVFQVWTDGVKQYDSGVLTGPMPGAEVTVSLIGVTEIALIVTDGADGTWSDHGDWADVRITCGGDITVPTVPTVTTSNPAVGAGEVAVNGIVPGALPERAAAEQNGPPSASLSAVPSRTNSRD